MDRVKIRFSSMRFQKVIDSLSEDQKGFVVKHGLQNLMGVRKFSIPIPLLEWVMGQVITDSSEFKHRGKSFKLTTYFVEQIIGIPSGDIPIILSNSTNKKSDTSVQSNSALLPGSKVSIRDAVAKLCAEHDENSFIRLFMLVSLSTIICPTTQNFINTNYLPYLMDISEIKKYDWYNHVLSYLLSEVKKYQGFISSKDDGQIYVGSCLPLIAVSHFAIIIWFWSLKFLF